MSENKSSFTGKLGFVLAAAGSAVGLGNIWRFPYLAAKYGGGIFLLVYLVLVLTLGFSLMAAEIAIGRKTGKSALGAFGALSKKWSFIGILASIVPAIILPYYSVIGGWIIKYMTVYVTGGGAAAAEDGFFGAFSGQVAEPIIWFLLFIGVTTVVVLLGVEKGIEKVSKIMMPILVILTLILCVYTLLQPGAIDGLLYYITPDFSKFSITTVLAAMGQMFYSMSLAMGIMVTYGSYMKKNVSLEASVTQIEIFDTGVAFLAGLLIVPAVFVFSGGDEAALGKGVGLMFITLPKVFESMPAGGLIGAVFFVMVLFAALTSSISIMETVVASLQDKFGWGRKKSVFATLILSILLGIPSSLGFGVWSGFTMNNLTILEIFDFISNSVMLPIVALLISVFVGYVVGTKAIAEEVALNGKFKREKVFNVVIKYVAPICIVLILISSILDGLGIMPI